MPLIDFSVSGPSISLYLFFFLKFFDVPTIWNFYNLRNYAIKISSTTMNIRKKDTRRTFLKRKARLFKAYLSYSSTK
jgi:hypothetical protein